MPGVEAGEEGGTARCADTRAAVGLEVTGSFCCELIQAGSLDQFLAIASQIALGNVIAEDEDEVGLLLVLSVGCRIPSVEQNEAKAKGGYE